MQEFIFIEQSKQCWQAVTNCWAEDRSYWHDIVIFTSDMMTMAWQLHTVAYSDNYVSIHWHTVMICLDAQYTVWRQWCLDSYIHSD